MCRRRRCRWLYIAEHLSGFFADGRLYLPTYLYTVVGSFNWSEPRESPSDAKVTHGHSVECCRRPFNIFISTFFFFFPHRK